MQRNLVGGWRWVVRILAVAFTVFQLYTSGFGLLPLLQQRSIHAGFALVLCFFSYQAFKTSKAERKVPIWDILLSAFVIISVINLCVHSFDYMTYTAEFTTYESVLAAVTFIIVLESGRRAQGLVFPVLTLICVLYAVYGRYFPGDWGHAGMSWLYMLRTLYQGDLGMMGFITGISATVIAMFIIFGGVLQYTEGGETFILLAKLVAGRLRGGPALVSVVASAFFGTISGSAVANVAGTGNFTIPLMKRLGYPAHYAGAVESAASTGGQFTPPIMGAGAFVMAELLRISYLKICLAAAIPALLFYVCLFIAIYCEAGKRNLVPIPKEELPKARDILTWPRLGPLLLPVAILIYFLLAGYTIWRAGFWACMMAFVVYLLKDFSLAGMKQRLVRIEESMEKGAMSLVSLVPLLVCASIVVSLLNTTGLGIKLSVAIMGIAGTNVILALVLAAVVTIVLGMGMPTTAAYIIAVTVAGTGLIEMGLNPLAVHMFCFFFACISGITPPVCLTVYTAAGIAKTGWLKIAFTAIRLGIVAYLVPFIFIYSEPLLFQGPLSTVFIMMGLRLIGVALFAVGFTGWFIHKLHWGSRIFLVIAGLLLVFPHIYAAYWSVVPIIIGIVIQWLYRVYQRKLGVAAQ